MFEPSAWNCMPAMSLLVTLAETGTLPETTAPAAGAVMLTSVDGGVPPPGGGADPGGESLPPPPPQETSMPANSKAAMRFMAGFAAAYARMPGSEVRPVPT
jgi:hypothetical protein